MKQRIFFTRSFIAIILRRNNGLIFWFKPMMFNYGKPRKYQSPRFSINEDLTILTLNEEDGLKYLSRGLDKIINKTENIATPKQRNLMASYRTLMNEVINYYNSEWKI